MAHIKRFASLHCVTTRSRTNPGRLLRKFNRTRTFRPTCYRNTDSLTCFLYRTCAFRCNGRVPDICPEAIRKFMLREQTGNATPLPNWILSWSRVAGSTGSKWDLQGTLVTRCMCWCVCKCYVAASANFGANVLLTIDLLCK